MRICVIGWPGTGKTTLGRQLAAEHNLPYLSTDDVKDLGWSESSLVVSRWLDESAWVIEGVALPRALRKWQANNPGEEPPVDQIIRLTRMYRHLPPGAIAMGKDMDAVLAELEPWLGEIEIRA